MRRAHGVGVGVGGWWCMALLVTIHCLLTITLPYHPYQRNDPLHIPKVSTTYSTDPRSP